MNHSIRKAALLAAVGLPAALGAQAASAALITEWDYEIDSAFTDFTETGGDAPVSGTGGNSAFPDPNWDSLSWGVPTSGSTEQSSVSIDPNVDGSGLVTNGAEVAGSTFTHNNNVITLDSSELSTFKITTQLFLSGTSQDPADGDTLPHDELVGPIVFESFFTETTNAGPCVEGSDSECDDIFVLDNASTVAAIGSGQSFFLDDFKYTVSLDIEGLDMLTGDQCEAAGLPESEPCVGFLTQENTSNVFESSVSIRAVPAPAVLALFGIGLLGLGFFARRGAEQA